MAFDFSIDDLMDSGSHPALSDNFSSAVLRNHNDEGGPLETSAKDKNRGFSVFSFSELLQGKALYGNSADVLKVLSNQVGSLLAGTTGIGGNEEGELGGGFDNLLPQDIKDQAAKYRGKIGADIGKNDPAAAAPSTDPAAPAPSPTGTPGAVGNVEAGNCPADIPRGPFQCRIVRRGYTAVNSDVPPVQLTNDQVLRLLLAAGCPQNDSLVFCYSVTLRESTQIANICGIDNGGGMGVGLWQITRHWPAEGQTAEEMCDPWTNAMAMKKLSSDFTSFIPWQTSGNYSTADGSHVRSVPMDEGRAYIRSQGINV